MTFLHKKILLVAVAMGWAMGVSLRADDVADVRKAFDLYVEYTRTADKRSLDLFAKDVSVTNVRIDGGTEETTVIPAETFLQIVKESIDAKAGDKKTYEEIRCVAENGLVKLTCTCVDGDTGERDPLVLIYSKDPAGQLKIKAMKTTYPPLKS